MLLRIIGNGIIESTENDLHFLGRNNNLWLDQSLRNNYAILSFRIAYDAPQEWSSTHNGHKKRMEIPQPTFSFWKHNKGSCFELIRSKFKNSLIWLFYRLHPAS